MGRSSCFPAVLVLILSYMVMPVLPAEEKSPPVEEQVRKLVIGKWRLFMEQKGVKANGLTEYKADGTICSKGTFEIPGQKFIIDVEGTWTVTGNRLTWTVTKTSDKQLMPVGDKHEEIVLEINDQLIRYRDDENLVWTEQRVK